MKKRIFQIIASVIVVVTLLNSFYLTSFAASVNINGTGSGNAGGSANTNSSGTGYSVQSIANFAGYRFTYMSSSGKFYGAKDVISSSQWSDYTGRNTTTYKYNKKDLIDLYKSGADFTMDLTTASSSTAIKDDGSYGLSYSVDTASSKMKIWIKDATYVNKILKLMGYEVKNMKSTDQILVEPIILCQVGGTNYALTLTEIWMMAGSQFGYSTCAKWGGSAGTYDNLGYRLNGTFPDNFYVDEKNNICDVATALNPELNAKAGPSFANLITKGYGLHIISKEAIVGEITLTINYYSNYADSSSAAVINTVGGSKNVLVKQSVIKTTSNLQYGLYDYSYATSSLALGRTGYSATGDWNTKADRSGYSVNQSTGFNNMDELAEALGVDISSGSATVNVYAQWKANTLTINYYSNGADYGTFKGDSLDVSGSTNVLVLSEKYNYDKAYKYGLANVQNSSYLYLSKTDYVATGNWNTKADGSGFSVNQNTAFDTGAALAKALGVDISSGSKTIDVYAQWVPAVADSIDIDYVGNGATEGEDWTEMFKSSENNDYYLSDNSSAFIRTEKDEETGATRLFKFTGWTIGDKFYPFGEKISMEDLMDAAITQDGRERPVVTVYATWDEFPTINAVDRWFTLDEAQSGKITLEELLKTASAVDGEIGDVTDFEAGEGTFTIIDFDAEEFKKFTTTGSVTVTYQAIDKAGNETYRTVTVHIVDKNQQVGNIFKRFTRFISEKFFKDSEGNFVAEADGGFNSESRWINDAEYVELLTKVFSNKQDEQTGAWDTVYETWTFTKEDIEDVKGYVGSYGLGNSKNDNALINFYDMYKD